MNRKVMCLVGLLAAPAIGVLAADPPTKYEIKIPKATVSFDLVPVPSGTLKGYKSPTDTEARGSRLWETLSEAAPADAAGRLSRLAVLAYLAELDQTAASP